MDRTYMIYGIIYSIASLNALIRIKFTFFISRLSLIITLSGGLFCVVEIL